jgi:hypothetical protein
MRNDDPMYVRHLERALEAAELEIKGLEAEARERDKVLMEMQEQLAPTRMGEPVIWKKELGEWKTSTTHEFMRGSHEHREMTLVEELRHKACYVGNPSDVLLRAANRIEELESDDDYKKWMLTQVVTTDELLAEIKRRLK